MIKKLTLEVLERKDGKVKFRVAEQTHRGKEFGSDGNCFNKSKLPLYSDQHPYWYDDRSFYVKGVETGRDNDIVSVYDIDFLAIETSVAAYNDHFNSGIAPAVVEQKGKPKSEELKEPEYVISVSREVLSQRDWDHRRVRDLAGYIADGGTDANIFAELRGLLTQYY